MKGSGWGGGLTFGTYEVTGTVKGFNALSNGFDIHFTILPFGLGEAAFSDNNGRTIGEGTVGRGFSPAYGAGLVSIDPPTIREIASGTCKRSV